MPRTQDMVRRLERSFSEDQAEVLAEVISDAYDDVVKAGDFNELKGIVGTLAVRMEELAQAQSRTDARMEELAQAQGRTEVRMEELAQAQGRTEVRMDTLAGRMEELAQAQGRTEQVVEKLIRGIDGLRQETGGLSRSVGYALENDAYRALPAFLEREHGLRVTDRFVRTEIAGEEINFLARAERSDGRPVLIVGESKARLDERRRAGRQAEKVLEALEQKVAAAAKAHPEVEVVPLLVTHYARPAFLEAAQARGVIVVQSFEWT